MDFDFNDQQLEFQEAFRDFLAHQYTLTQACASLEDQNERRRLWSGLADLGAFSMLVPSDRGGLGLSAVDLALVLEEFGRALVPLSVSDTLLATDLISRFGSSGQKARLFDRIASGQMRISLAAAETDSFRIGDVAVQASANGAGWSLSGKKILVAGGGDADLIAVVCRLAPAGDLAIALIEPDRTGVSLRRHETLDLTGSYHELNLSKVVVGPDDLLGRAAGSAAAHQLADGASAFAALQMMGIAGKVLDVAVQYAMNRVQFGKPIGSFQAIKHRCADMAVSADTGRTAAYYAAWAFAEDAADRGRAASTAKSFCGDAARFVCNEAIQIHGGMGFTWELGLHNYLRRAKVLEYAWGDASYHRERVMVETLAAVKVPA
jgi:alkylation response protein AidB-like acyl-CoA dehydrogenase